MDWAHTTTRTIDLGYEQLLTFEGRPGTRIRVLYGAMWLTEEGCEQDVFACCGDEVELKSGGLSVVEGLGTARVQVIEPRSVPLLGPVLQRARRILAGVRARMRAREVFARSMLFLAAVTVSTAVLSAATPGPLFLDEPEAQRAEQRVQRAGVGALLHDLASAGTGFLAVH